MKNIFKAYMNNEIIFFFFFKFEFYFLNAEEKCYKKTK